MEWNGTEYDKNGNIYSKYVNGEHYDKNGKIKGKWVNGNYIKQ